MITVTNADHLTAGAMGLALGLARTAALVLAVPVVLNTAFKAVIAIGVGGWHKGRHGALPLLACAFPLIVAWLLQR